MGRLVYVREDREAEPRFAGPPARGDFPSGRPSPAGGFTSNGGGRQLYVSNLPFNVGWQDLKDLFRQASQQGNVVRADVLTDPSGRPKGSGIVVFESAEDARTAIQQFNGYDWQGRVLEVREDRYANAGPGLGNRGGYGSFSSRGGFGGPTNRGGFGGRGGYSGGYGGRGGHGGSFSGGGGYDAPGASNPPNPFTDFATSNGERSGTIFVRNLPWSTCNDDLVELFSTIGKVERAEIQYETNGRSRGSGVVEFDGVDTAQTAIDKFSGYQYGGRPLGITFVRYMAPSGQGDATEEPEHAGGLTQDQMM